jgi:hypothetical protein
VASAPLPRPAALLWNPERNVLFVTSVSARSISFVHRRCECCPNIQHIVRASDNQVLVPHCACPGGRPDSSAHVSILAQVHPDVLVGLLSKKGGQPRVPFAVRAAPERTLTLVQGPRTTASGRRQSSGGSHPSWLQPLRPCEDHNQMTSGSLALGSAAFRLRRLLTAGGGPRTGLGVAWGTCLMLGI